MSQVREHLESAETDFLLFSQTICPYCTRAERTLDAHGFTYTEVNLDHHDGLREDVVAETRHRTVPIVFALWGAEPALVGGSDRLPEYLLRVQELVIPPAIIRRRSVSPVILAVSVSSFDG